MNVKEPNDYIEGVLQGSRRALAEAITLIQSEYADHRKLGEKVLSGLLPHTEGAVRLGISGVPGVGKSAFIETFGKMLVDKGRKVAVLANDPSSTLSGGSVLEDKSRLGSLAAAENAYIGSLPTGDTLGGVARRTRETMMLCEAAGFDVVIVETMGVGQPEAIVTSMVDLFLVPLLPGASDQLQGFEKGVLEMSHALVANKAEGDSLQRALNTRDKNERAMHMLASPSADWVPPVLSCCSAKNADGLQEIWDVIKEYWAIITSTGGVEHRRKRQTLDWMWDLVQDGLEDMFHQNKLVQTVLPDILQRVEKGRILPTVAAKTLLGALQ